MTLYKSIKKSKLEIRGGTIFITIPQEIFNLEKGPYFDEHGHKFELGLPAHMSFRLDGTIPEWYIETVTVEVKGIPEMIEIATGGNYKENDEEKHNRNAKFGWYRYDTYFAIPVHTNDGEVDYYNVFHASLLIRHSEDGKKYLYDIIDIKKETSYPLEP